MRGSSTSWTRSLAAPGSGAAVFGSICLLSFLVNYGRMAFAPLVDHFIQTGTAPAVAGLAATAVWLGSGAPRLPTGWVLTMVRRHQVILGVGIWLAISTVFTALSPTIWMTIAGAFTIGIATGAFFIAANPLVSELYPRRIGTAIGIRGTFSQLGAVAAPFLVAASIWFGSWRIGFLVMAVFALLLTGVLYIAVRRTEMPTAGTADRDLLAGIRGEWKLVLTGIAFVGLTGFVWQGVFNFYITYLTTEKAVTSGTASALLTLTFAAGIPSWIIGGRLADRLPKLWLLFSVLIGFIVALLGLTIAEGILLLLLFSLAIGFVIHGLFPIGDAYLLSTLPDHHRASAYAGFSASMMLIQAPGSVLVGLLVQGGVAYDIIFQLFAVGLLLLAAILLALSLKGKLPSG